MVTTWLLYSALVWSIPFPSCVCLRIAWLVPGPGSTNKINSDTSVAALKLALRSVEKTSKGSGKNVGVKFFDTDCTTQAATSSMFAQRAYNPDVIIGPPCKAAMKSVAQLAGFWNVPLFGWYNPDIEFDAVKDYPTLIRMAPSANIMAKSLIHIMHQNGWRRLFLLHDTDHVGVAIKTAVVDEVSRNPGVNIFSSKRLEDSLTPAQLELMFSNIKKHVTIVVLACSGSSVRRYLLAADKVGMTNGQYVFIQLDYEVYSGTHLHNTLLSDGSWRQGDIDDQTARHAYETLIHVVLDPMADDGKTIRNLPQSRYEEFSRLALAGADLTKSEWQLPGMSQQSSSLIPVSSGALPDVYSLYLYDSIVVWSVMVDHLNQSGIDHRNGTLLARMAKNFFADGATGYIQVNEDLDRVGKVFILDMGYDGTFKPVQVLRFNRTNGYSADNLVPFETMFRWSSGRMGQLHTPSDIPSTVTSAPPLRVTKTPRVTTTTPRATTTTTTTTTSRPTTTTTTATPKTTTRATTTTTAAPDPMSIIMNRLASLEAFLTKSQMPAKSSPATGSTNNGQALETIVKSNVKPQQKPRTGNIKKGLNALKDSFATHAQGRNQKRGRHGNRANKARRVWQQSEGAGEVELVRPRPIRKRPIVTTAAPYQETSTDWYETPTTTQQYFTKSPVKFPAAMEHLFATAVENHAVPKAIHLKNRGHDGGGQQRGAHLNKHITHRELLENKQQNPLTKNGVKVLGSHDIQPLRITNPFASNPIIDQISAKVAARITESISQKLIAAKQTMKNNHNNFAVSILGDWIPGSGEDGLQKMNMTVKVDKTNNKDLKVTAQGMPVENTITQKIIDTATNKTTSVTIEPPKPSENENAAGNKKATTPSNKDVTVAPTPAPIMYHPPWAYMYPPHPPAWQQSSESSEQQSGYEQQPPYPFPHHMFPYPQQQQEQPPSSEGGQPQHPPYPPPGYAPYPMYPMYAGYPQWGQQSNSEAR